MQNNFYIYFFSKNNGVKVCRILGITGTEKFDNYTLVNNKPVIKDGIILAEDNCDGFITKEILPETCKLVNGKVIPIDDEESNLLLIEHNKTPKQRKLDALEKNYREAQYLIVQNGSTTFKVALRNEEGYLLLKERVVLATIHGSASLKALDLQTNTEKSMTLSKDVWVEVGKKAEDISFSNWNKKDEAITQINNTATLDELETIDISFPPIETITVTF